MWPWQEAIQQNVSAKRLPNYCRTICICSFVMATAPLICSGLLHRDFAAKSVAGLLKAGAAAAAAAKSRVLNLPKAVSAPIAAGCDCHWPIKVVELDGGCDLLSFLCSDAFSFFYLSRQADCWIRPPSPCSQLRACEITPSCSPSGAEPVPGPGPARVANSTNQRSSGDIGLYPLLENSVSAPAVPVSHHGGRETTTATTSTTNGCRENPIPPHLFFKL